MINLKFKSKSLLTLLLVIFLISVSLTFFLKKESSSATKKSTDTILEYELVGGFSGFCDYLEIKNSGKYFYQQECNAKKIEGELNDEERKKLDNLQKNVGQIKFATDKKKIVIDAVYKRLDFYGHGSEKSAGALEAVDVFINEILTKIKTQISTQ